MKKILFTLFAFAMTFSVWGQRNCGAMDVLERQLQEDPSLQARMEEIEHHTHEFEAQYDPNAQRVVYNIPVVVHIVHRTNYPAENITDAQVISQINVLNQDFRKLNADANLIPGAFAGVAADFELNFCLAQRTPGGAATTGIMRYQVARNTDWGTNDAVKTPAQGGVAPWDATKYLNLWVCSIGGGILGYAQFPGGALATDGVVCDYRYFGTVGAATPPFNKGRTATHEVGHYFNLRHIWGDANCGSDLVGDTPTHNTANYGCPTYPHLSTCAGTPVEQTMNYMDYTDDACMYMFTAGQKARAVATLAAGGYHNGLTTSDGCTPPVAGACGVPASLTATNVAQTTATLNWGAVAGATNYNVQIQPNGGAWTTFTAVVGTSLNVTGLTASTVYNFKVQTNCNGTLSAYSGNATFTTLGAGCTDVYEANETKATAKTVAMNATSTAKIGTATDKDYFKFTTTAQAPKVRVELLNLPADYDLKLYRVNTLVGTSQNAGVTNEILVDNSQTVSRTYTAYVYGYGGAFNANSCYSLRVTTSNVNLRGEEEVVSQEILEVEATQAEEFSFRVAPNPTNGMTSLFFNVENEEMVRVSVLDLTGRELRAFEVLASKDGSSQIDLSGFSRGMYFVRMENGETTFTQKVIKE